MILFWLPRLTRYWHEASSGVEGCHDAVCRATRCGLLWVASKAKRQARFVSWDGTEWTADCTTNQRLGLVRTSYNPHKPRPIDAVGAPTSEELKRRLIESGTRGLWDARSQGLLDLC